MASLLMRGRSLRGVCVTSALREEGRTSVALAMASVQRHDFGRSVALVDMDFQRPTLSMRHGANSWPGLAEVVRGEANLQTAMQEISDGVQLVGTGAISGALPRSVSEIVSSDVLANIAAQVDIVVADLPPLLGNSPGYAAARLFEDIVLVVRAGITPVARVKEAAGDLPVSPHVLLNGTYSSLPGWLRRLLGR
jgi:Mrp family chromosome partitioning ATPase